MIRHIARFGLAGLTAFVCLTPLAASAAEPASVKVTLWEKDGGDGITLSTHEVKAGAVEFEIKNTSKQNVHEFLITLWKGSSKALPYNDTKGEVREDKLDRLAGVEDMKPEAEATLRLPMKPGHYAVFCNQAGHYKMGMVADFVVDR